MWRGRPPIGCVCPLSVKRSLFATLMDCVTSLTNSQVNRTWVYYYALGRITGALADPTLGLRCAKRLLRIFAGSQKDQPMGVRCTAGSSTGVPAQVFAEAASTTNPPTTTSSSLSSIAASISIALLLFGLSVIWLLLQ